MVLNFKQLVGRLSKKYRRNYSIDDLLGGMDPKLLRRYVYLKNWSKDLPAQKVQHRIKELSKWLGSKPSYTGPFWKKRYAYWIFKYGKRVVCLRQSVRGLELFVNERVPPAVVAEFLNAVYVKVRLGKITDHSAK
jgi:hypothetical protein